MTEAERQRFFDGWVALREACRKQHPKGPGGAMICACGAGAGGSAACSMLRTIHYLIVSSDDRPEWWESQMEALRSVVH
jgi:hypothetical protein